MIVSKPSLLDGLHDGNDRNIQVCGSAPTPRPTRDPSHDDDEYYNYDYNKEEETDTLGGRRLETPANSPTYMYEESSCCMGSPAASYLVACIVKDYPKNTELFDLLYSKNEESNKQKFKKHKLNEYCEAAVGVCGTPCGFGTSPLSTKYCRQDAETGLYYIPSQYLFGGICEDGGACDDDTFISDDKYSDDSNGAAFTPQFHTLTNIQDLFHVCFMAFMTITVRKAHLFNIFQPI